MKNTTELLGNWNETKGKLKQIFGKLTDSDVLQAEGKQEELIGRLQTLVRQTKEKYISLLPVNKFSTAKQYNYEHYKI